MATMTTENQPARRTIQHDPYRARVLGAPLPSGCELVLDLQDSESSMNESPVGYQKELELMADSIDFQAMMEEGGLSESGSEISKRIQSLALSRSSKSLNEVHPVSHYASVNFRFGSAWFVAPFRTFVGDMVVVEYPHNNSLHMGLVSCITTTVPPTFVNLIKADGSISPEDLKKCPRLLRHARDFDKETKKELRSHDLASLESVRELAERMQTPVTFLDAEWLLDLTAVTFLVDVWGDMALVDRLADELAAIEGAEVVFTFPATY